MTIPTLLRYPGGKSRARNIILPMIPDDVNTVLSPFFGGGSIELSLLDKGLRIQASDGFFVLTVFWNTVITDGEALADALEPLLHHVDKTVFKDMQHALIDCERSVHTDDPIGIAKSFYVVNRCSFSGETLSGGFSQSSSNFRFTQSSIDRIREFSSMNDGSLLSKVEHADYETILSSANADMMFLDPPYCLQNSKNNLYGIKGNLHKGFDHQQFHDMVMDAKIPFLLTYNNCAYIRELWHDCLIKEPSWAYGMNATKKSNELIITKGL